MNYYYFFLGMVKLNFKTKITRISTMAIFINYEFLLLISIFSTFSFIIIMLFIRLHEHF